ncbi:hypothetical protein H0H92_006002 [Tricholoma furcatifolium]|nr:hypothetical protein H0H92_006002 [Tricholoma furcatifolium]
MANGPRNLCFNRLRINNNNNTSTPSKLNTTFIPRPNTVQPEDIPLPPSRSTSHISSSSRAYYFDTNDGQAPASHLSARSPSVNSVLAVPPSTLPMHQRPQSVQSHHSVPLCIPSVPPADPIPPRRNTVSIVHNVPSPVPTVLSLHTPPQPPFYVLAGPPPPLMHPQPHVPFVPPSVPPMPPVLVPPVFNHTYSAPPSVARVSTHAHSDISVTAPPAPFANPTEVIVTDSKTALPSLTSIPTLHNAADWPTWEAAVFRLVDAMGLRGYLCRIPQVGDLVDPTSRVVLPPHYDFDSPPHVAEGFRTFWVHNDIVEHILVGKLTIDIAGTLPPKRTGPFMLPTRTARDTLAFLRERYSVGSASTADMMKDGVVNTSCAPGNVVKFVESWRNVVHQLVGSPWDFSEYQKTQKFVDGLPNHLGWAVLKDRVRQHWLTHNSLDNASFTFESLATEALDIHYKWKSLQRRSSTSTTPANRSTDSSSADKPDATSSPSSRPVLKCSNCGGTGHTSDRCWQKGGGAEGQRDTSRICPRANVAAEVVEPPPPLDPVDEIAEIALDVPASDDNEIFLNAYDSSDPISPTPFAAFIQSSSPPTIAFLSTAYNALLDSGCSTHIIRDRRYFWSYDESGAVDVGTANCGILSTLARGEVRFRAHVDGKHVVFILRDCLHAPDVPINLLSVGSMVENRLRLET